MQGKFWTLAVKAHFILSVMGIGFNAIADTSRTMSTQNELHPTVGTFRFLGNFQERNQNSTALNVGDNKVLFWGAIPAEQFGNPRQNYDRVRRRIARADYTSVLAGPKLWNSEQSVWQTLDRSPECQFNHFFSVATSLNDDQVLITGGACDRPRHVVDDLPNVPYTAVSLWDSKQNKWLSAPAMLTSRFFHTATRLNDGSVLIVGGESDPEGLASDVHPVLKAVERFAAGKMELVESLNVARAQHTATLLKDGSLLVIGGMDEKGVAINSAERWSKFSWTSLPPLKNARYGHSASLLADGRVLVAGGVGISGQSLSSVEIYDPEKNSWTDAPPLLQKMSHPLAINVGNSNLLVVGSGSSQDRIRQYIYAMIWSSKENDWLPAGYLISDAKPYALFSLSNEKVGVATDKNILQWQAEKQTTLMPNYWSRLGSATCVLSDGRLFVAGGDAQGTFLDWAEIFDPSKGEFQLIHRMQMPRNFANCLSLDDGSVIVAGGWARAKDNSGSATDYSPEMWNPKNNEWNVIDTLRFYKNEKVVLGKLKDGNLLFIASKEFDDSADLLKLTYRAMIWNSARNEITNLSVPVNGRIGAAIAIAANGNVLFSGGFKRVKQDHCIDAECESHSAEYSNNLINTGELWNIYSDGVSSYPIESNQRLQSYSLAFDVTNNKLEINAALKTHIALADDKNNFYTLAAEAFSIGYTRTPQPGYHWDSHSENWQSLAPLGTLDSENLVSLSDGTLVTSTHFFYTESASWVPLKNETSKYAHSLLTQDGNLFSIDLNSSPYVSVFSLAEKKWKPYFNENNSLLGGDQKPVVVDLGKKGVMVITDVLSDLGQQLSAHIWNPKTHLWSDAGELSAQYSEGSAFKLSSGKVIFLGYGTNEYICEIWSPLDNSWTLCGTFPSLKRNRKVDDNTFIHDYISDPVVAMKPLSDGRAAVVLVNTPDKISVYDEAENDWKKYNLEVDNSDVPFGAPVKTKNGYYARVFDDVNNRWVDASDVAAANFHPYCTGCNRFLWNPQRKYWEYVSPPLDSLGTEVVWTQDGCALSIPFKKMLNRETGKIETLIIRGVDPNSYAGGVILGDGSLVVVQKNLPILHRAVSCNGIVEENKIEPIVKKPVITAAPSTVSIIDRIHTAVEEIKSFLNNFSWKILGITFLFCLFIFFIKMSLDKKMKRNEGFEEDYPEDIRDPKARLALKFPLRVIVYTVLAIIVVMNLRNYFALKKISNIKSCSTLSSECLDKESGILKPFESAKSDEEDSKKVSVPCKYVGIWSSIQGDRIYRVILREDGTFEMPASYLTHGQAYTGHWGVQGNKMIWSYAHSLTDDEDVNEIHPGEGEGFTLTELYGKKTRYELISRIKSSSCQYD